MTSEEAKKYGFRTAGGALYVYWCIENGHIYVRSCDACALTENDFPTREKARDALRKRKMEAEHAKWLASVQSQTTPITPEQLELLHVGKDTVWAVHIAYGNSITREIYDGNKTFKCFYFSEASALAAKQRLDDYEHEKWIKNHESQMTPVTLEQAKMLRPDDTMYGYDIATLGVFSIRGNAKEEQIYAKSPLFFTEQAARNRLNEVIAAQAALDKAKCSTLPEGVAPVPEGYEFVDPNKIEIVMVDSKTYIFDVEEKRWHLLNGFNSGLMVSTKWNLEHGIYFARPKTEAEPQPKVGDFCDELDIIRARYRNPLWLAKHGKSVASHETPVGETQAKEVVTDETQHSPSRPLSDSEFKNLVGRMSLPQLYDALKANGVKLEGIGLEPNKVDEQSVLEEAAKCVTGPRRRDYGTPDENFGLIASLWSVQLKHEVTPMQVALCLILLKVARQANSPKRDNLVDIAGYAQCASELKGAK